MNVIGVLTRDSIQRINIPVEITQTTQTTKATLQVLTAIAVAVEIGPEDLLRMIGDKNAAEAGIGAEAGIAAEEVLLEIEIAGIGIETGGGKGMIAGEAHLVMIPAGE